MTREEFEKSCYEVNSKNRKHPTDAEYEVIEYVYNFHPAISETEGKRQIATLYVNYDMSIIQDMKPRAERMEKLEKDLRTTRAVLEDIENEIAELRAGGEI